MPKLCGTCQKIIAPGHVSISIMNEDYHQQCLVCSKCGANLGGRPFIQKRTGEMYCEGQCEDSVTLPAINGNASSRNVFLFHQDPNIYREKINSYKEDLVKDLAREDLYDPYFRQHQHQHPAVVNESGKRSYNLDLYKKPPPKLSANLDIFKQTNYMNDNKNSKNIYEPFSYNYPSNGTLPINEKNPMSNSNNSLKNSKKTEPFSYNYRDTDSSEIEETASFTNYNNNRKVSFNRIANTVRLRTNPNKNENKSKKDFI